MAENTKDEALAFIHATRMTLEGKVGFKWLVEKLSELAAYVERIAAENERLHAHLDAAGMREDYESFCAMHPAAVPAPADDTDE
jgi:hypothetical protein